MKKRLDSYHNSKFDCLGLIISAAEEDINKVIKKFLFCRE